MRIVSKRSKPTGWRSEGFEEKYLVAKITDPNNYEKFSPPTSALLLFWSLLPFFVISFFAIYVLHNFVDIGAQHLLISANFILV
jgi:alkylglycerol monooxygenase